MRRIAEVFGMALALPLAVVVGLTLRWWDSFVEWHYGSEDPSWD